MISLDEFKEIGKELGLVFWKDEDEYRLSYNSPLFNNRYAQDRLLDSAISTIGLNETEYIYLYEKIELENNPIFQETPYYFMVNKIKHDEGKYYKSFSKEEIKEHLIKTIQRIKRKQNQLKLKKMEADFD